MATKKTGGPTRREKRKTTSSVDDPRGMKAAQRQWERIAPPNNPEAAKRNLARRTQLLAELQRPSKPGEPATALEQLKGHEQAMLDRIVRGMWPSAEEYVAFDRERTSLWNAAYERFDALGDGRPEYRKCDLCGAMYVPTRIDQRGCPAHAATLRSQGVDRTPVTVATIRAHAKECDVCKAALGSGSEADYCYRMRRKIKALATRRADAMQIADADGKSHKKTRADEDAKHIEEAERRDAAASIDAELSDMQSAETLYLASLDEAVIDGTMTKAERDRMVAKWKQDQSVPKARLLRKSE